VIFGGQMYGGGGGNVLWLIAARLRRCQDTNKNCNSSGSFHCRLCASGTLRVSPLFSGLRRLVYLLRAPGGANDIITGRPYHLEVIKLNIFFHQFVKPAKASPNLLQRTGGDHRGGRARPGWRTFMMTCLRWILGYMRCRHGNAPQYLVDCCTLVTDVVGRQRLRSATQQLM